MNNVFKFFQGTADKPFMKAVLFIIFSFVPYAVAKSIIGQAKCDYIKDPIYIKTTGCGGLCTGFVNCIHSYPIIERHATLMVSCHPVEEGICPEANKCLNADSPRKFTVYPGNPDRSKKKHRETTSEATSRPKKASGATQ